MKKIFLFLIVLFSVLSIYSATSATFPDGNNQVLKNGPVLYLALPADYTSYSFGFSSGLINNASDTPTPLSETEFSTNFEIDSNNYIINPPSKTFFVWWKIISHNPVSLSITFNTLVSEDNQSTISLHGKRSKTGNENGNSSDILNRGEIDAESGFDITKSKTIDFLNYVPAGQQTGNPEALKWGIFDITLEVPSNTSTFQAKKYSSTVTLTLKAGN